LYCRELSSCDALANAILAQIQRLGLDVGHEPLANAQKAEKPKDGSQKTKAMAKHR
jgi:hypothetical protein